MFDSILLQDFNGATLAEFISHGSDRVIGWLSRNGWAADQLTPGVLPPLPARYTVDGFLRALGTIAAADKGDGLNMTAASRTDTLPLTRTMSAARLAQLTDLDVGAVRDILKDFLTFPGA